MKANWKLTVTSLSFVLILVIGLLGCGGGASPEPSASPEPTVSPTQPAVPQAPVTPQDGPDPNWQWPEKLFITAAGTSGMTKYVSWTSLLEKDTGMAIFVVPENNPAKRVHLVGEGEMFIHSMGKSGVRTHTEALDEYATKNGGGFQTRSVWIDNIAYSAVFVRGDSDINTIYDIKPGVRWSVWSTSSSILKVPKAILDWVQVPHEEVKWVVSGSTEGAVRAVVEGRADIMWFFPSSSYMYDAAAAPHSIKFLDLNSDADPEGAARFRESDAMYTFGVVGKTVVPPAHGVWGTVGEKFYVTRAQTDPNLVYNVAKWIDENYDVYKDRHGSNIDMSVDKLVQGINYTYVPVHEGLIWLLKEKGLWTAANDRRQAQNIAILQVYIDAYAEALAKAEAQGLKIDPGNQDWIDFWENYKLELNLPKIAMHQNLDVDAPWVKALGLD
jgi:uncharacterized protein